MTLKELSEKYGVAESTLKNAFPRAQKSILKKYNVNIVKKGRGETASYEEEVPELYPHAMTMYEEVKEKDIFLDNKSFHLKNGEFLVFLAILTTPMFVFRGDYNTLLKYIGINQTAANVEILKKSINILEMNGFIAVIHDIDNVITISLRRAVEKKFNVGLGMIRRCKMLAEVNHKRSWIPLLKTWVGMRIAYEDQPTTLQKLSEITGLSIAQLRESKKILEEEELFRTRLEYASPQVCIGQSIELNGIYNN